MSVLMKEVFLPQDVVRFDRSGLQFLRPPSWEEWGQIMLFLGATRVASLRWMADARLRGRREFGDEAVIGFEEQMDLDSPDLKAAMALEALECRSDSLTDQHLFVLASRVHSDEDRQSWMDIARKEGLSPRELQASIAAHRVIRSGEAEKRAGGMATIEGVRGLFDLWAHQVPEATWKGWDEGRRKALLEEILPIIEMGDWVRASLGEGEE